jgi:hypothetical protein
LRSSRSVVGDIGHLRTAFDEYAVTAGLAKG